VPNRFVRTGHEIDKSDAHCVTSGASVRTRLSVMRAVGPAMLTVPTVKPSAPERIAAAIAVTPGSASFNAKP